MKLSFKEIHKSVDKEFSDIEIADFSIFTGKNGSGKTHLLGAIKEGKIAVDNFTPKQILYLDYIDFATSDFQRKTNRSDKANAWNRLSAQGGDIVSNLKNLEGNFVSFIPEIEAAASKKDKAIFDLTEKDFTPKNASQIIESIKYYRKSVLARLEEQDHVNDDIVQSVYQSVIRKSDVFLSNIPESKFNILFQKTAISNNKLLSDLSSVFYEYYKNQDRNDRKKQRGEKYLKETEF